MLSLYVSIRSEFRAVMSFTISMSKQCSGRLYLLLFEEGLMSYLRYLCLLVYSGVQHILCCVFVLFFFDLSLLPVSLDSPFLIAPSVFSNIYLYMHITFVLLMTMLLKMYMHTYQNIFFFNFLRQYNLILQLFELQAEKIR